MYKNIKYCMNCGCDGHSVVQCKEPTTSYGIILLNINTNKSVIDKLINSLNSNEVNIMSNYINENYGINYNKLKYFSYIKDSVKMLLIQRKHSLGLIEFIRGKYKVNDHDRIIKIFKQMTSEEINILKDKTFNYIWRYVWGNNKNIHCSEYINSKRKFEMLKNANTEDEDTDILNLSFYIKFVKPTWNYTEWGFPKGRRNYKESDKECAIREFVEETDFSNENFDIIDSIDPIVEYLIGTNGIRYKHVYYLAISKTNKIPYINANNKSQKKEIGGIKYFNFEELIQIIRDHHVDRKKIITNVFVYLINILLNIITDE